MRETQCQTKIKLEKLTSYLIVRNPRQLQRQTIHEEIAQSNAF